MQAGFKSVLAAVCLCVIFVHNASAQNADQSGVALKKGESANVGNLFWVANCKSLLTGPISVEVMEGPPGVTASVKEQKIVPHKMNCANAVPGGVLVITAPAEVKERMHGTLTVRMKYPTKDGERQQSRTMDVTVFP